MKRFLVLAALVLGLASCQREPEGLDINVGGEVATEITVSLPEDVTRAVAGEDSAQSDIEAILDKSDLTLRYILQVFDAEGESFKAMDFKYADAQSVVFPVRLVPNRHYRFVVWADVVNDNGSLEDGQDCDDLHYVIGTSLRDIKLADEWKAMDETRDAYTGYYKTTDNGFVGTESINITLTRPFAKLRVVTTDIDELFDGVYPHNAEVTYTTNHYKAFDAFAATPGDRTLAGKQHTYVIDTYSSENPTEQMTLYTDYFFATEEDDAVRFNINVKEADGTTIKLSSFNTDIKVKRNYLTTLIGDVLTEGNNVNVNVQPGLGGTENPDINYNVLTSGAELLNAISNGGSYMLGQDIYVSSPVVSTQALTRADEGKTTTINLNGYTITVKNTGDEPFITVEEGDTLVFSGDGNVTLTEDSNAAFINNEGDVVLQGGTHSGNNSENIITGDGDIFEAGGTIEQPEQDSVKTQLEALKYILANGGEFTMTENLEATDVLEASATKPVILNGNNKTISTSANRIVRITNSNANVTINDVNFVSSAVMVYPNDVRGVAIDPNLSNIALTLNNCTIDFTDETTNDWTYAVNISGNGTGHKVTVNGGTYEGANVINAHGAKNTIVVKNATLTSLYPNSDVYYGACIWVLQNQESSVYAEGNTFNGNNALAFNLGTGTALEEKNNTDNTKYVAAKVGGAYYYNIADAINAAENGETVKVLQSHDCNVGATVATGKTLTLDLNGETVEGTDTITDSFGLITNKGNLTVKNGTITLKAENNRGWNAYSSVISNTVGGNLVVENVTIEHLGGTDMAYGIDNLTNGKGTVAVTTIEGATVKSTYRAVRQFLNGVEATNELYVKAGSTLRGDNNAIFFQDPNKNANPGKLVVEEGAALYGNVYLFVTEGSTEWPVEVSVAASALKEGEVTYKNVPEGYKVVEKNGAWIVVQYAKVASADELVAALEANKDVIFTKDIKIDPATMSNAYGTTGINVKYGQTIDGNGFTLDIKGAGGTWDSGINTTGGLIKNITVTGSFRGIFINHNSTHSETVVLDNVTIEGTTYTISCDQGLYQGIEATNCTFNGWTSFAKTAGEAKFVNCSFGEGSGYKYCRPYAATEFVGCEFEAGYTLDPLAAVTFEKCTLDGVALTAANIADLVSDTAKVTIK